jgi:hypothetical protein
MLRGRSLRPGLLLSRGWRSLLPQRRRRLLRTRLRLSLWLTLWRRSCLLPGWQWLRLLNLLLTLLRWGRSGLVLSGRWRLLRTRLWLDLLRTLRRCRCGRLVLAWRWRLLRARLWLNLLLLRRRSRSRLVLRWLGRLLRTSLRLGLTLNLLRGWRRCGSGGRLISSRLIAIRLRLDWGWRRSRRRLRARTPGGRLTGIGLNILPGCVGLPGRVLLLSGVRLLRCVRLRDWWNRARGRSGTRRNYRSDGFALRYWLRCCNDSWLSLIHGNELLSILRGLFAMLNLSGHRGNALFASSG